MSRLTKIAAAILATTAVLAVPALAQAKPGKATVLQVNRGKHHIELVDGHHVVHSYVFSGRPARKLRHGAVVTYRTKGKRITSVHVVGRARKVSYIGKIVSSGRHGVVLQLADGRRVRVGKTAARKNTRRARAAGSVSISLQGLKPGQVVMITESDDGQGNVSITIKLVQGPAGGSGDATGGEDQDVVGTVTAIASDGSSLTLQVDGKPDMTFQTDPDVVDGVSVGDQVDVTYFQDTDGSLVADDVEPADDSSSGDDQDAIGTVTAVAADGSSLTLHVDGKPDMTFQTDPSLVDGVNVGDQVDVTYFQDTDGTLVADDVEAADSSQGNSGDGSGDGSGDTSGDGSGDSSSLD